MKKSNFNTYHRFIFLKGHIKRVLPFCKREFKFSNLEYLREEIEKLVINSGKIVGKDEFSRPVELPTA